MRRIVLHTLFVALFALSANTTAQMPEMKAVTGSALTFTPLSVPGFAEGMTMAPMVGDPSVADQAYTLRLKFPAGYRFPAHFHPKAENLTVISGTFLLAMGKDESAAQTKYAPGDYLFIPPTMPHSGGADVETVIQLHGVGPFEIILANPAK